MIERTDLASTKRAAIPSMGSSLKARDRMPGLVGRRAAIFMVAMDTLMVTLAMPSQVLAMPATAMTILAMSTVEMATMGGLKEVHL